MGNHEHGQQSCTAAAACGGDHSIVRSRRSTERRFRCVFSIRMDCTGAVVGSLDSHCCRCSQEPVNSTLLSPTCQNLASVRVECQAHQHCSALHKHILTSSSCISIQADAFPSSLSLSSSLRFNIAEACWVAACVTESPCCIMQFAACANRVS